MGKIQFHCHRISFSHHPWTIINYVWNCFIWVRPLNHLGQYLMGSSSLGAQDSDCQTICHLRTFNWNAEDGTCENLWIHRIIDYVRRCTTELPLELEYESSKAWGQPTFTFLLAFGLGFSLTAMKCSTKGEVHRTVGKFRAPTSDDNTISVVTETACTFWTTGEHTSVHRWGGGRWISANYYMLRWYPLINRSNKTEWCYADVTVKMYKCTGCLSCFCNVYMEHEVCTCQIPVVGLEIMFYAHIMQLWAVWGRAGLSAILLPDPSPRTVRISTYIA